MPEEPPVPISLAQWPEARSFQRVYSGNPEYQARLAMALFGFIAELDLFGDERGIKAVEEVVILLRQYHPEFMQDGYEPNSDFGMDRYSLDERLKSHMERLDSNGG